MPQLQQLTNLIREWLRPEPGKGDLIKHYNQYQILNDGYLGSHNDEERSEVR